MIDKKIKLKIYLKDIAILIFFSLVVFVSLNVVEYGEIKPVFSYWSLLESRGYVKAFIYAVSYFSALFAVLVLLLQRSLAMRIAGGGLVFVGMLPQVINKAVTGNDFGIDEARIWLEEIRFFDSAISTYGMSMVLAILILGLVIFILMYLSIFSQVKFSKKWFLAVPFAISVVGVVTWWTGGVLYLAYPTSIRTPIFFSLAALSKNYDGDRADVVLPVNNILNNPKHIILLVDESIRGDFIGLNGSKNTTPFLNSFKNLVNLGVASATANYSAPANIILRSGLGQEELPDKFQSSLKKASIFNYAKGAQYRAVLLDAQSETGRYQNNLTSYDIKQIDTYWAPDPKDKIPICRRDRKLLEEIVNLTKSNEKNFIFAVKMGCHFPYFDKYPDRPENRVPKMGVADSIKNTDFKTLSNTYENCIQWSSDEFLKDLLNSIDLEDVVVVYTSDHGQSLKEGNIDATQGVVDNPPASQANIPILIFGEKAVKLFDTTSPDNLSKASAFQIFPTLLIMMGYDESSVISKYGVPLWMKYPKERKFLTGDIFARGRGGLVSFDSPGLDK